MMYEEASVQIPITFEDEDTLCELDLTGNYSSRGSQLVSQIRAKVRMSDALAEVIQYADSHRVVCRIMLSQVLPKEDVLQAVKEAIDALSLPWQVHES